MGPRVSREGGDEGDLLLEENGVALCGPVMTELRRGLRTAGERRRVLPLLSGVHLLPQPHDLRGEAGELGAVLARRGLTPRSFDLLIATYSLSHDVPVLSGARDFRAMQRAGVPLALV